MLPYATLKLVAYCLWCWLGLRLLAPSRARPRTAIGFGALRWLLGLGFGLAVAVALGSISGDAAVALYVGIYLPLRIVEWGAIAVLPCRLAPSAAAPLRNPRAWLWILGGIAVSFASDLASPEGLAGRFCVGRCLC